MIMRTILLLLLCVTFLSSCDDELTGDVLIRVENISTVSYSNIKVGDSNGTIAFKDLGPGEFSEYAIFQKAYRYAYVELQIDGLTYFIQPIDFVGEEPLRPGNYTYQLDASENATSSFGRLSINLISD